MSRRRDRLAQRRKAVGLSQERLAELVAVDRSTIVRWERADTDPQPWHRPTLARALKISVEELAALLERSSDGHEPSDLTELLRQIRLLDERYDRTPSSSMLAEASRLHACASALRMQGAGGRARRDLWLAEAEASILLGQLVWDASQRRDGHGANRYFDQAIVAAREIADASVEAYAELRKCYVALYGTKKPTEAIALAERAAYVASPATNAVRGLAHLHAAEAYAMIGDVRGCDALLGAADHELETMRPGDPAAMCFSPSVVGRLTGSCYLHLGQPAKAEKILLATHRTTPATTKPGAVMVANLALAAVRQGNMEASVARLHEAIEVVEQTRGGGGLNVVFGVARELQRWRTEAVVAEVQDRLLALMTV